MPEPAQQLRVADAGQLQQLRGVDRRRRRGRPPRRTPSGRAPAAAPPLDADRAAALEQHAGHLRPGAHLEVGAGQDRVQVGAGRRQPAAAVHVAVERPEALLPVAVDVRRCGAWPACSRRVQERPEQRVGRRAALEHQRPVAAAPVVGAGQAGLHPLEVRQRVRVVPAGHPRVGGPALVVQGVAALEDHPVDAAGAAEHLAAGVVDAPAAHVRLGLGGVLPVVEAAADRVGQRRGHVDEDVPGRVPAARLQHQHPGAGVLREPVRHARSRPSRRRRR